MTTAKTLVCALALSLPLLAGCSGGREKSVEEMETESVRNERRTSHQKKFQQAPPADTSTPKK